ncbi:MAG: glycogen synthase [Candidatus Levybacteria bacterium]|nr:glycogen synthase [Candidatus Levybacteria bacterium]
MNTLRVLLCSYEAVPFYKKGGLGDVAGALPKALREVGVDARLVMPFYDIVRETHQFDAIGSFTAAFNRREERVTVHEGFYSGEHVPVYFLANKRMLANSKRRGSKSIEQYVFFSLATAMLVAWLKTEKKWISSIVHCNDWHTALVPLLLRRLGLTVPTLLTIHNLEYQGRSSLRIFPLLGISERETRILSENVPATQVNLLQEGILHADKVSTVSPTYAKEIVGHAALAPINDALRVRNGNGGEPGVVGILNGIDYDVWNPKSDHFLPRFYDATSWQEGKQAVKKTLLAKLSLAERVTLCFIGRMAWQKGIDVLARSMHALVSQDVNIIFLGMGMPAIEQSAKRMEKAYPKNVRAVIDYDEPLAHRLYAASDFMLIPSRYEPCGLIQMIAIRYGTLPIASKTGGLSDSIQNGKNGFLFKLNSKRSLVKTVKKALHIYHNEKHRYERMVVYAMRTDFSWKKSALAYKRLYKKLFVG